jgi:catechol 2,3-dioxygenase-like lactoylglutathione lyase family enzyme
MFKGLRGITYKVSDIEKAKNWYSKVFDTKPILDTSFAVLFSIGDSILALILSCYLNSTNNPIKTSHAGYPVSISF